MKEKKQDLQKNIKSNKGITLISLIITITVLLILAVVTLNLTFGERGIFRIANNAGEEYKKQTATEKINLKITNSQISTYTKEQRMPTLQELANDFCEDNEIQYVELTSKKTASLGKVNIGENKSFFTKLKEYPYEFEINSSLQLASIDGIKIAGAETGNTTDNKEIENLKQMVQALSKTVENQGKEIISQNETITTLNNKVTTLENETIVNKREKLLSEQKEIPLTTSKVTTNINIELKKELGENVSIRDYKYIEIQIDIYVNGYGYMQGKTIIIATEQLNYNNSNTANWVNNSIFEIGCNSENGKTGVTVMAWFSDNSSDKLNISSRYTNRSDISKLRIINIYGIK